MKPPIFSLALAAACLSALTATAAPVITEFMADNKTTLADEDGAHSDWVEIFNPDATGVNLAGWALTDNASNPSKWIFPAVTLPPGEFLLVWASGKNRAVPGQPLHTNFSLSAGGEYLALTQPGGTVAQEFAPTFPAQQENVSFGRAFTTNSYIATAATAKYLVPVASVPTAATWTSAAYSDSSWSTGVSGFGFGLMVPGMTVKEANAAAGTSIGSLAVADAVLAGTPGSGVTLSNNTQIRSVINFLGDGGDGHFGAANGAPNNLFAIPGENHCIKVTGVIGIAAGQVGTWTFGVNSDDGSRLRIDLNNDGDFADAGETVILDDAGHGPADRFGTAAMTGGNHAFEFVYFEGGGGDEVELFATPGTKSAYDTTFRLLGDTAAGGLAVSTLPAGLSGGGSALISTNIQSVMQPAGGTARPTAYFRFPFTGGLDVGNLQALSLSIRYNDGFVAWLNGTEVARRNAPTTVDWQSGATASRTDADSLVQEPMNVTAFRTALVSGSNVLAIQGLNTAAGDASFLIQPELSGGSISGTQGYFFKTPTPGKINAATGTLGYVADTTFSHKRGLYTAPFTLALDCATPGATIRYTTDGSKPTASTGTAINPAGPNVPPHGEIVIAQTTVLRAAAFKAGYDSTNVDTNTYLFLDDVIRQQSNPYGAAPAGWPTGPVNGQVLNYGMDQNIVENASSAIGGVAQVKAALTAIPSICVSTPVASLVDPATGIYTHAGEDGFLWEREASIEMLNDPLNNGGGFQENCGIRIRGGYSRQSGNPKHAFRIIFRSDYGSGKLDYPIFPWDVTATTEFDKFDIQTAQNYSWSLHGDAGNVFLREQFSRDSQLAVGSPGSRGRFVHLYLDGIYWGLYQIEERPEADWAARYFGGTDDDYDVVKVETSLGYVINPTAGDLAAWQNLWTQSRAFYNDPTLSRYRKMLGLNPDGTPSATDPVLLDADNLIDYMMVVFFVANADSPLNGSETPNNFYVVRDRRGGKGFIQIQHDAEHSMDRGGGDRTGPFGDPVTGAWNNFQKSNPQFLHQDLMGIASASDRSGALEYKTKFGDRVQKHMIAPGGAMTLEKAMARLDARAAQVESAIIAESARWGDAQIAPARNANDWRTARDALKSWLNSRHNTVISQLQGDGLFPTLAAPVLSKQGGSVLSSTDITLAASTGTVYYTTDGSDPRLVGGGLHAGAQIFQPGTSSNTSLIVAGSAGQQWRYLDNGTDQGTAWRLPGFNDSTWKGPARGQFGYGDNDEVTRIEDNATPGYVAGDTNRYITSYFRTTFTVANPVMDSLLIEAVRDDGIVVYVNGTELVRDNLPAAPAVIGYLTPASVAYGGTDESSFFPFSRSAASLVAGVNTMAVEIHQNAPAGATVASSTDVSFDLRATAIRTTYPAPIHLTGPGITVLKSRVRDAGGNWSALTEAEFLVGMEKAASTNLVVSEIMYHPANPTPDEALQGYTTDDVFEFLELQNIGALALDLRGCFFSSGIDFTFPTTVNTTLPAGGRLVLAKNAAAFQLRYPGAGVPFGEFEGSLDNSGETIALKDPTGATILAFTYGDGAPWPGGADGGGHSLVLIRPSTNPAANSPDSWRTSIVVGGTPGGTDAVDYISWKAANAVTADSADPDADGLSAFLEYALGTAPQLPNGLSLPELRVQTIDAGAGPQNFLTVAFPQRAGADDLLFAIESSTGGSPWAPATLVPLTSDPAAGGVVVHTFRGSDPWSAAAQRTLYRVKVSLR